MARQETGGRRRWTAKSLRAGIEAYFTGCDGRERLYSEAGLCLALDVPLDTLRGWYDGTLDPALRYPVQRAYLRIQDQITADPRYQERSMATRGNFLCRQPRFGGYQDRAETPREVTVHVKLGDGMDLSDFG